MPPLRRRRLFHSGATESKAQSPAAATPAAAPAPAAPAEAVTAGRAFGGCKVEEASDGDETER